MTRSWLIGLFVLAAALAWPAAALAQTADEPPVTTDASAIVLRLDDLPAGFAAIPGRGGPTPNDLLAKQQPDPAAALAQLQSLGRTGGFASAFRRPPELATTSGDLSIQSWVSVFDGSDHAASYMTSTEVSVVTDGGSELFAPAIGAASAAYRVVVPGQSGGSNIVGYRVLFRISNVVAGVDTAAFDGLDDFSRCLELAQLVASRVQ